MYEYQVSLRVGNNRAPPSDNNARRALWCLGLAASRVLDVELLWHIADRTIVEAAHRSFSPAMCVFLHRASPHAENQHAIFSSALSHNHRPAVRWLGDPRLLEGTPYVKEHHLINSL